MRATGPDAAVAPRWRSQGAILLVSCYELGHQPLGLAWPKAFLERAGYAPATVDLAVEALDESTLRQALLIAIAVPMHTALRLGVRAAERIRRVNPVCRIVFHGLYALLNAEYLLEHVADAALGGETEGELVSLVQRLDTGVEPAPQRQAVLGRLDFPIPSRAGLPALTRYVSLAHLGKGHPRADIPVALAIVRRAGIALRPSFVPFTPWSTLADYLDLLDFVEAERLIDHVDPVQYTIRLLIPPGSLLLSRPAIHPFLGALDRAAFTYRWTHPDPRMDALQRAASALVERAAGANEDAWTTFYRLRALATECAGLPGATGGVAS